MPPTIYVHDEWMYLHSEELGYDVKPHPYVDPPSSFFKYYALNQNSVDALTNMYIYATHPKQFNDPFDCNENLIKFSTWADVRKLCDDYSFFQQIQQMYPKMQDACKWAQSAYWLLLYKKLGLVSLTTSNKKYKMWALYAQNNGFCLEFDVERFPFKKYGPFPIHYVDYFPNPLPIDKYGGHLCMLIQTNLKNKWWEDENEWRLLVSNPCGFDMKSFGNKYEMNKHNFGDEHDRKFRYPLAALKSVTLGPKFFDNLCFNIASIDEYDVVCHPDTDKLEFAVLDFLARITEKNHLEVRLASLDTFDHFNFTSVKITQYGEGKFRICFI